jgi:hypothetical protein
MKKTGIMRHLLMRCLFIFLFIPIEKVVFMLNESGSINCNQERIGVTDGGNGGEAVCLIENNSAETNVFEDYINEQLLKSGKNYKLPAHPAPLLKVFTRTGIVLLGATWGIPWWSIALEAIQKIIPDGVAQQILMGLFAVGEVITVGADGAWIMLELGDDWMRIKTKEEEKLPQNKDSSFLKSLRNGSVLAVSSVFATASCISPVYAILKYAGGESKYTAIFTLVGNFGKGVYGYSKLINKFVVNPVETCIHRDEETKRLVRSKKKLIESIDIELAKKKRAPLSSFDSAECFFSHLSQNTATINRESRTLSVTKACVAYPGAALIAISSTIVGFYLVKEAFQKNIYNNPYVAVPIALLADLPSAVVNFISTKSVLEKIVASPSLIFSKNKGGLSFVDITRQTCCLLGSLAAPTAASYITYNTLNQASVPMPIVLIATVSIGSARIIFSNFTLNNIAERAILFSGDIIGKESCRANLRLKNVREALSRTRLRFFGDVPHFGQISLPNGNEVDAGNVGQDKACKEERHSRCCVM